MLYVKMEALGDSFESLDENEAPTEEIRIIRCVRMSKSLINLLSSASPSQCCL